MIQHNTPCATERSERHVRVYRWICIEQSMHLTDYEPFLWLWDPEALAQNPPTNTFR